MAQLSAYEKSEIKALRFEQEEWFLDLERLVTAGNGIFHAVTEEIQGPDEIVGVLDQLLGRDDLAKETQRIVADVSSGEQRFYELVDDQWIPLPEGSFVDLRPMSRRNSEELAATLASLRAIKSAALAQKRKLEARSRPFLGEDNDDDLGRRGARDLTQRVEALGDQIEALARRFESVEARLVALEGGLPRPASPDLPAPQPPDDLPSQTLGLSPSVTENSPTDPRDDATTPVSLPNPEGQDSAAADPFPDPSPGEEAPTEDEATPPPIVALPLADDLRETLEMLVGDELPLVDRDPDTPLPKKNVYFATFIDRGDAVVGGAIADRAALVSLGGALLLLPQSTWKDMLREGPSADILDAMSEILNNIAPLINQDERNTHVRTTAFIPLGDAPPSWVEEAQRVVIAETELGGTLTLLAAPEAIPQDDTEG